jgi:hypothetical protein
LIFLQLLQPKHPLESEDWSMPNQCRVSFLCPWLCLIFTFQSDFIFLLCNELLFGYAQCKTVELPKVKYVCFGIEFMTLYVSATKKTRLSSCSHIHV